MKNLLIALSALLVVALMTVGLVLTFAPDNHVHEYTSAVEKAATCTSNGKMVYTCSCGNNYAEKIDALGHAFITYVSDGNATCTENGTVTAKCDRCDATDTMIEEGTRLDHTYDAYVDNGDNHVKSCDCGAKITEVHIWEEADRLDATHTADGQVNYACVCGATKIETLDMLIGCLYNKEVEDSKYLKSVATCTEAAVYYKSCVCGEFSEEAETFIVGEPNGHSNDPWNLVSSDAAAQTAVLSYKCWDCDEDVTITVNFADCEKTGTLATCESNGYETVVYVYYIGADRHAIAVYSGVIEALGHNYGAPVYTWNDDFTACTATMTCANDPSHVVSEDATVDVNVIAPKCFEGGKTVCTATFANDSFATQVKEKDATTATGAHVWDGTACTVCNAVKFEAETFEFINVTTDKGMLGTEGKGIEATQYPSGDAFVYNLQYSTNTTLKFTVNSSVAQTVTMTLRMGCRDYAMNPAESFTLKVNGVEVSFNDATFPKYTKVQYWDWLELAVAELQLNAGDNVIEFTRNESDRALNFDYVSICPTEGTVSDPREADGHSYTNFTFTPAPDYANAGAAYAYCDYCRNRVDATLPVVSAENGYVQLSYGVKSAWKYTTADGIEVTVEVPEESKKFPFLVTQEDDVFTSVVDDDMAKGNTYNTNKCHNTYGIFYELTQGATFTFKVNASQATQAVVVLTLRGNSNGAEFAYKDMVNSLVVNGAAAQIANGGVVLTGWAAANNVGAEIAIVDLVEGENTITFTMANLNINIAGVEIHAFADITHEPVTAYGGNFATFDPFLAENGGSAVVNDATAASKGNKVNNGGIEVLYQNNRGNVYTMTVNVAEPTTIVLRLGFAYNKTSGYTAQSIATITSTNANGSANKVYSSTNTIKNGQWKVAGAVIGELATIELQAGTNTITLAMGTNNVNITGVYIVSNNELTFGKE